jgi:hypothetical protein
MDLASLFPIPTLAEVKAKIAGFAELGNLLLTAWQSGDSNEQFYQAISLGIQYYTTNNSQAIRGFYLDTATDPGDPDPYNPDNELLPKTPGYLTALGESMFFTQRPEESFATTSITFANGGIFPAGPFGPGDLTVAHEDNPEVTYKNAPMDGVYTGPGGTLTVLAGQSPSLDFIAESPGPAFNADPSKLTVLVTAYTGVTVTNPAAAIGTDRMEIETYRALCRTQATTTSPNGGRDAYLRWSRLNRDGSPLLNSSDAAVGITRVQVSGSSVTGNVFVYYADDDGAAIALDVTAANDNIELEILGIGDTITFTGAAAVEVPIVVTWAVEYSALFLGRAVTGPTIKAAINAALEARFPLYPVGGFKQTLGAGSISLEEIRATVKGAHPAIGDATLSSPVGSTALAIGRVPVLTTPTGTETAV